MTIVSDRPVDRHHPGVESVLVTDPEMLRAHIDQADAVVVFGFDIVRYPFLANSQALRIVDLYDPWIFGSLEQYDSMSNIDAERSKTHEVNTLNQLADVGDFFICASERQRDFWLGLLASRGRLDKASHEADHTYGRLSTLCPMVSRALRHRRRPLCYVMASSHPSIRTRRSFCGAAARGIGSTRSAPWKRSRPSLTSFHMLGFFSWGWS